MATKKQHTDFNREVAKYLQSIGAEFELSYSIAIRGSGEINTIAGVLSVLLLEPERSEVFSIYCCFYDVQKAEQHIPSINRRNNFTGKWNFHSYDAKELLDEFKEQIAPLLINEKV